MDKQSQLSARFKSCWIEAGGTDPARSFLALAECYNSIGRYYHNLTHIEYCLNVFDQARGYCQNACSVELAIWFHDVIYDFHGTDNELQSAEYFLSESTGLSETLRQTVYELILATDHSRPQLAQIDHRLLVEIDLSGFGLPWQRFEADSLNVRNEMVHLRDDEFYPGQLRFMQSLMDRVPLYQTDWFNMRFEQNARANIARHMRALRERGYELAV